MSQGQGLDVNSQSELIDIVTERPITFMGGGKRYFLYQPTLGKMLVVQKLLANEHCTLTDIPSLVMRKRELCCTIVAYSVLCNRRQIFNAALIKELTSELSAVLDDEDLCKLLAVIQRQSNTKDIERQLRLDVDDENRRKVAAIKKDKGSTVIFGGHSIYGNLLDAACQRYGWTLEHLLWEVSYANVHLMLKDAVNSVYLTEDERKKVHLRDSHESVVDAADPKNRDYIAKLLVD